MTKKEERLEALQNLRYQVELSKEYARILAQPYIAVDHEDERFVRQAIKAYLYDLEDSIEEEFEALKKHFENDKKGDK